MATLFSTGVIRDAAKGRAAILDAGCGTGIQALYLARRNSASTVYGYDINPEAIRAAEVYKEKHGIANATFAVASHKDFAYPHTMDMIYTAGSLVGEHEIPTGSTYHLHDTENIVRQRLSRFSELLTPSGVYAVTWLANDSDNAALEHIAEGCGLRCVAEIYGETVGFREDLSGIYVPRYWQSGLVFEKE